MAAQKNLVLGRGRLYFSRYKPGTQVPAGFRYLGNTPELTLTSESTNLDHYGSDFGIREKDVSFTLEVNQGGSFSMDDIQPESMALFFTGESNTFAQTTVALGPETLLGIEPGRSYKLGISASNPAGFFGINETGFKVELGATDAVAGVDYTMNFDTGILEFLSPGALFTSGDDAIVTYAVRPSSRVRVISGTDPAEGCLMFISKNPKGNNQVTTMPRVRLSPNGDYNLKGDDWQMIQMSVMVLKPASGKSVIRDELPDYSNPPPDIIPNINQHSNATGTNTVAMPNHRTGDLIVAFAFREGSLTPPDVPLIVGGTNWIELPGVADNLCSAVIAYKTATSNGEICGTFAGASSMIVLVLRGNLTLGVGQNAHYEGFSGNKRFYPVNYDYQDGTSTLIYFIGDRGPTNTLGTIAPVPMSVVVGYSNGSNSAAAYELEGVTTPFGAYIDTNTVTDGYISYGLEITNR